MGRITLLLYGVKILPGFSIQGGNGPKNSQETARRHRYELETLGPLNNILIYAHKAQRPVAEIDKIIMHHGQDEVYYPGKNRWQPIDVSFYEAVDDTDKVATAVYQWWSQSTIAIKQSQINAQFRQRATLSMLNPSGDPIYKYTLYDCWPILVTPDALDYGDSGIAEITVKIVMNKATETS